MPMTEKQYRLRERNAVRQWRERLHKTDAGLPFDPEARATEIRMADGMLKVWIRQCADLGLEVILHPDLCMCVYCMGHPVLPTANSRR